MIRANSLTYSERRKFSGKEKTQKIFNKVAIGLLGLTLAMSIGDLIINPSRIANLRESASNYLAKKADELDRENYLRLRKYVSGEEQITPVLERGWDFYAEKLKKDYPCAKEIGSTNQWRNFFKTYNGGGNPTIGKDIRFPKLSCE